MKKKQEFKAWQANWRGPPVTSSNWKSCACPLPVASKAVTAVPGADLVTVMHKDRTFMKIYRVFPGKRITEFARPNQNVHTLYESAHLQKCAPCK